MSVDLSASLEIGQALDGLNKSLLQLQKLWLYRPAYQALPVISKASANPALTWMFIDCGGPNAGRLWETHILNVCGDDPSAQLSATSVVAFLSNGDFPQDGTSIPTNLFIINPAYQQAVPVSSIWGHDQVVIRYPMHLGIGVKGIANSTNVHVSMAIKNWDEDWLHLPFASP